MQVILSNPYYSLQISIIIKLYTMYLAKDICQAISRKYNSATYLKYFPNTRFIIMIRHNLYFI